ncbi:MAG: hypothetical protein QG636_454 [Patescibacteria group bacterium]|nr:hypothetical protein [Patescibacteria group bacterium]
MQNLMTPNSSISRTVMRRVRIMHATRTFAPVFVASVLFMLAVWEIGREVWVTRVFENMPSYADIPAMLNFFADAFINTEVVVQMFSILALGALVWLARSFALLIGESLPMRRI